MFAALNSLDTFLLGLVGLFVLMGGYRGFSKMVFSWTLWISSAYMVYHYSLDLSHTVWLQQTIGNDFLQIFAVLSGIVAATFLVSGVSQMLLGRALTSLGLVLVDRFLGLYLGFIQGALLVAVLVLAFAKTPMSEDAWWQNSQVVRMTMTYVPLYSSGSVEIVDTLTKQLDEKLLPLVQGGERHLG